MKKQILLAAAIIGTFFSVYAAGTKVKVVHKGHVIEISESALKAHLDHGDELVLPPPPPDDNGDGNDEGGVIV